MDTEALLLAKDSFSTKEQAGNKVSRLSQVLLDDDQLLKIYSDLPLFTYGDGFEVVGEECGLDPPIALCKPCREFMQSPSKIWNSEKNTSQSWVPFHENISQLGDCCHSSKGTCRICCLIWNRTCILFRELIHPTYPHLHREYRSTSIARDMTWIGDRMKVGLQAYARTVILRVSLGVLETEIEPQIHITKLNNFIRDPLKPREDIVDYGDPYSSTSRSTGSPATLSQIKKWLESCKHDHSLCNIRLVRNSERPTRLIKIEDGGMAFSMKDGLQNDVKYVAISYRWGSSKEIFKLERSTLPSMKEKNYINLLPKTLREVCHIAHHLGFEYVWIDRLCIIQDCDEDWEREASKMGMVYSLASLTIAVSCASNEDSGCFRERNLACVTPIFLRLCPLLDPYEVVIYNEGSDLDWQRIRHGCLKERGWTLQEWLLSTRLIHFSRNQVYWECRQIDASEAWPSDPKPGGISPQKRPPFILSESKRWSAQKNWAKIVEDYSGRKFSFGKDMFPAISGLARFMEELAGGQLGQYLAGLWHTNFIQWLCWRTGWKVPVSLPDEYLAPSWSWASLHGNVSFIPFDDIDEYEPSDIYRSVLELYLAELKHVEVTRVSNIDSYAAIRDGWIVLSGHMKRVQVGPDTMNGNPRYGIIAHSTSPNPGNLGSGEPDLEDSLLPYRGEGVGLVWALSDYANLATFSPLTPIYCLPLVKVKVAGRTDVHGLLLIPCASRERNRTPPRRSTPYTSEEYERVGITTIRMGNDYWDDFQKWCSRSPKREIVIR
ncbi:heterokaryon incompatibility protein-domain-containing protein [Annulohypoxylon moriforme]|nr:heterokaryon incompatibility protein-domain-containing protein [Annulohypoxylon moriforme]